MIFSWRRCVALELIKGLHPRWCDCSDRKTADYNPPSAPPASCLLLSDSPPGFPLLPVRLQIFGMGSRPSLMKPLLAVNSEQKKKADISSPLVVCPPPTFFFPSRPVLFPLFTSRSISLSSFLRLFSGTASYFCSAFNHISSHHSFSLSPSMMEPADRCIRIPDGHPLSFYCLALAITHGW